MLVTTQDYEHAGLQEPEVKRILVTKDTTLKHIIVTVANEQSNPVPASIKANLLKRLNASSRTVTWEILVQDAVYTTIGVTYTIVVYPSFDPAGLIPRINAMLGATLTPATWGTPSPGDPSRLRPKPTIRKNELANLIGDVNGVNYVQAVTITAADGTFDTEGNLTMPGAVPLPKPGIFMGDY